MTDPDPLVERKNRSQRAHERRKTIVAYSARDFDDAEQWDLAYWQSKTPQERLSALIDIRRDVEKVEQSRSDYERRN